MKKMMLYKKPDGRWHDINSGRHFNDKISQRLASLGKAILIKSDKELIREKEINYESSNKSHFRPEIGNVEAIL